MAQHSTNYSDSIDNRPPTATKQSKQFFYKNRIFRQKFGLQDYFGINYNHMTFHDTIIQSSFVYLTRLQ